MEGVRFGDFEVKRKIGEGGMGQVYLARQISLDREVALKVLPERLAQDRSFRVRFEHEARSAARLNHPNIISVYASGIKDGVPYFAMEYVDGEDLASILRKSGKMPVSEALRVAKEVARALDAAHRQGVIHRDIKPSNIMIRDDGVVKVTDFGLAKALGAQSVLTQANVVLGTPHYMSPEQGKGAKVDGRSDIYSLGVVLYEMLCGDVPFKADTPTSVIYQQIYEEPPPLSEKAPHVPRIVEAIVMRMLQKDPAKRFQKASDVVAAIEQAEKSVSKDAAAAMTLELGVISDVTVPAAGKRSAGEQGATEARSATPQDKAETPATTTQTVGVSPWLALLVAVVIIGGIGVAAFLSTRGAPTHPPSKTPRQKPSAVAAPNSSKHQKKALFPVMQVVARFPRGSRLFVRKQGAPPPGIELKTNTRLEVGNYTVRVEKKGYEPFEFNVLLDESGLTPPPNSISGELRLKKDLRERLDKAEEWENKKEFGLALKVIKKVLKEAPDYGGADLLKKVASLESLVARQKKAEEMIDRASSIISKGGEGVETLEKAVGLLKQVVERYKDVVRDYEKRVPPLLVAARKELVKEKRFLNALAEARRMVVEGDLAKARIAINAARDIGGGSPRIRELEEVVAELKKLESEAKDAFEHKDWQRALRLTRLFLKRAPQCERIIKRQKECERMLNERRELNREIAKLLRRASEMVKKVPQDVPSVVAQARDLVAKLESRHGLAAEDVKKRLRELEFAALMEHARRRVTAAVALLDTLLIKRDEKALLAMVSPDRPKLRSLLKQQLDSFLASGLKVIKSYHIIRKIKLSKDLKHADVEADYVFEFEHPEAKRKIKGVRHKRFAFVERSGKWLIYDLH